MSRKGENIYKRKDKRWEARYIRGRKEDGTALYGYCYGKTYREAKQKLIEAQTSAQQHIQPPAPVAPMCMSRFCEEWLQLSRSRVKESTYVKYRGILGKYIIPQFGEQSVLAINSVIAEQFGYDLLHDDALSPKTVRDVLSVLHSVLRHASRQYPISVPGVDVFYPKNVRKEVRFLSQEEQNRLVSYLLQDMDLQKFGTLLTLMTGLRLGELCALRWENVFLEERMIRVDATMQRLKDFTYAADTKTKVIITDPKSSTSVRNIPLTEQAVGLCQTFLCPDPKAFLLTGRANQYLEPRAMQYKLHRYVDDCGLEGVHFHTLRHTFATRCVEVNFEIKTLSEIMGHANPKITLERYVHSSLQLKRENMSKLSNVGL